MRSADEAVVGRGDREPADRGSATVLVLTACAVVALAAAVLASVAAVGVARHRSATAADLAALAAAARVHTGPAQACVVAAQAAADAGAELLACRLDGRTAEVTARVRPPGRLGELGAAVSRARAGPALP